MAAELVKGLYSTERGANIFIIDDPQGVTIIDAGIPGATKQILKLLAEIGRKPQEVKHMLITHADFDHVGSLGGLVQATGAEVYASAESTKYIHAKSSPPHVPFWMAIGMLPLKPFIKTAKVTRTIKDGDVLPIAGGLRVIATPGHTPDNYSFFWEREKVLFCADLLNRFNNRLGLSPKIVTHDMEAVKQNTRKVLALNPEVICVGHGETLFVKDSASEIEALLQAI